MWITSLRLVAGSCICIWIQESLDTSGYTEKKSFDSFKIVEKKYIYGSVDIYLTMKLNYNHIPAIQHSLAWQKGVSKKSEPCHAMGPMKTDSIKRSWSPRATFAAGDSGVGGRKGMSKTSIVSWLITLVTPLPSHTYNMSTHRSEGAFKLGSFHPNHWTASFFPIYIHIYAHFNIYILYNYFFDGKLTDKNCPGRLKTGKLTISNSAIQSLFTFLNGPASISN